jgi:anti-sigma factor RsiW
MPRRLPPDRLLRFLTGELSDAEARALRAEVERDPALKARLARYEAIAGALPEAAPEAAPLPPGFADRLARRLYAPPAPRPSLFDGLAWAFRPVALGTAALALVLGVLNVVAAPDGATTVEALFGLPSPALIDLLLGH